MLGVARGGSLNLAGAGFNQGMRLAITFLLAHVLGKSDVGLYFQAYAFLVLLDLLSLSGFHKALTRFVAIHLAEGDHGSLRGTVRLGLLVPTAAATGLGGLLYTLAGTLATSAFHDLRFAMPLKIVAIALPATVFTDAALAATQGFRTMRPYALVGLIFEPAFRIVLTIGLLVLGYGLGGAMGALLVTNFAAAFLAGLALRRLMGRSHAAPTYKLRELFAFSTVSWVATVASTGLIWVDTILLGIYGSPAQVGIYQVATRLVLLATVFMQPLGASFAPRVANLYQRGERDSLQKIYALVTSWIVRLSLPAFVILVVFPTELLALFGSDFKQGAVVTVLIAVGELFDVGTGPSGHMLLMSGRPALTMTCNIAGLALNIGLNLWLIPRYGIVGAGIAWAISLVLVNVMRVVLVWATMGMLPLDRGLLKALPAASAAAVVALGVRHVTDGPITLVIGVLSLAAVYLAVVMISGLSSDDRLVLTTLRQRFRLRSA